MWFLQKQKRAPTRMSTITVHILHYLMKFFSAKLQEHVKAGLTLTREVTEISHLFFVDDVMIFFYAFVPVAESIRKVLQDLLITTGLQVNCSKSAVFFTYCDSETANRITSTQTFLKSIYRSSTLECPSSQLS